jgi:hypothetical protein
MAWSKTSRSCARMVQFWHDPPSSHEERRFFLILQKAFYAVHPVSKQLGRCPERNGSSFRREGEGGDGPPVGSREAFFREERETLAAVAIEATTIPTFPERPPDPPHSPPSARSAPLHPWHEPHPLPPCQLSFLAFHYRKPPSSSLSHLPPRKILGHDPQRTPEKATFSTN